MSRFRGRWHCVRVSVVPPADSGSFCARCLLQNPARIGFKGVDDIWVQDVLNIGVDPRFCCALEC